MTSTRSRFAQTSSDLERWRRGDRSALDELCRRHEPGLQLTVRACRQRLAAGMRAKVEVADVVQETWVRAWADLENFRYEGQGSLRRWLGRIAVRVLRDQLKHWRAGKRDLDRVVAPTSSTSDRREPVERVASRDRGPATAAKISEDLERLAAILDRLPRRHRRMVVLAEFWGESWAEIAADVGAKSPDAARKEYVLKVLPAVARLRDEPLLGTGR